jgi:phenylpyruvate tautomerase PptA (4-oxalocrotonate tautomerase family)
MPLYRCTTPPDTLDDQQRAAIAGAITAIHCGVTQAPPTFVHVQFLHRAPAPDAPAVQLHGGLRAGRQQALAEAIVARCTAAVAAIAGVPAEAVSMRTSTTPASWILEGGRVMPEPGEEAAWLAGHADR